MRQRPRPHGPTGRPAGVLDPRSLTGGSRPARLRGGDQRSCPHDARDAQEKAFLAAIRASDATFKVVVNEVPIQQFYQLPYDRWEGYAAARTRLLEGLAGVKNVVFLTTDTHANMFGEIRLQTLEGPPIGTGIWEAVTGPVATNTYAKEIDAVIGSKGTGDFITSLFLKPAPPGGIGMPCAATDVFSYSEVVVTAKKLTVAPKTSAGAPVKEKTGAVCAPLVIAAR